MPDAFFALSPADRRDALEVAAARSGRAVHLLEKDVCVVWALNALFESDFAEHLVFKGGTSLSKAYQAIGRFSEDVDLTYDIRAIAPDLAREWSTTGCCSKSRRPLRNWSLDVDPFKIGRIASERLHSRRSIQMGWFFSRAWRQCRRRLWSVFCETDATRCAGTAEELKDEIRRRQGLGGLLNYVEPAG